MEIVIYYNSRRSFTCRIVDQVVVFLLFRHKEINHEIKCTEEMGLVCFTVPGFNCPFIPGRQCAIHQRSFVLGDCHWMAAAHPGDLAQRFLSPYY